MIKIVHRVNKIEELKNIPKGYGVEVDVRAFGKRLILNHEPYEDGDSLEEYLKSFEHRFIIFNIKDTGIENDVIELAEKFGIENYFLLDIEYPFTYKATRNRKFGKIAVRYSEAEPIEFALAHSGLIDWVWIDTFTLMPLDKEIYNRLKQAGFKICLVCPDQFGRSEDIPVYKEKIKRDGIEIDAVMAELENIDKWDD